jgi:hypothetical protein
MAIYNYFLPNQYRWTDDIKPGGQNVAWGALMVNACFSTLLLLGGILMLQIAHR